MNFRTDLEVNNGPVKLSPFVDDFLTRTVVGALSSLKGVKNIHNLVLYLEQGDVKLVINGSELPLTTFAKEIIANTIIGLVSPLKGVGKVDNLKINIRTE